MVADEIIEKMRLRQKTAMDRRAAFFRTYQALVTKTADPLVRSRGRPRNLDPDKAWSSWFATNVRPVYMALSTLVPALVQAAGPSGLLVGKVGGSFGNPIKILESMGFDRSEVTEILQHRVNISRDLLEDVAMYRRPNVYWENPIKGDDAEECLGRLQAFMAQVVEMAKIVRSKMKRDTAGREILSAAAAITKMIRALVALIANHHGLDQIASRLASFGTLRGRPSRLQ